MEIKHVCSIGLLCHSSQLLKINKLKKCSYPFDWIFSNFDMILHCIQTDFTIFLDKSYYINISKTQCGHSYYSNKMFHHHNPLINENDYNYYVRCINRFKQLLKNEQSKLFIMIIVNQDNVVAELKHKIINFNTQFSNYTQNYRLLVIFHIKNKQNLHYVFTNNDNIDFLELHTLSNSNGVTFTNNKDNDYLNNIINTKYIFDI